MSANAVTKRPLGALGRMGVVAGIHAAALYLIASSLGMVPLPLVQPIKTTFIDDPIAPVDPPPVMPGPRFDEPIINLTAPEPVPLPDDPPAETISAQISTDPPPSIDRAGSAEPQIVGVRLDPRHTLTQPAYPPADIREGREGTAEIEVYVLPSGRVGDARIVRSTGSATLDQSALDEARRRWRLLPATRDGEPFAQWHRLKVTFNLRNR